MLYCQARRLQIGFAGLRPNTRSVIMRVISVFTALFVLLLTSSAPSQAAGSVTAVGSAMHSNMRADNDPELQLSERWGFGGGVLLGANLGRATQLELGGIYNQKKWNDGAVPAGFDTEYDTIQVPLLLRFMFGNVLSLGIGGYYDVALENAAEDDLGVTGSVALNFPLGRTVGLWLDARYNYGFSDLLDATAGSQESSAFQTLLGLRFNVGRGR